MLVRIGDVLLILNDWPILIRPERIFNTFQLLALERRATHVENILFQNCDIFSVLSIFKYNPGETNNLLLLNNFYPVISYRRVSK